MAVGTDSSATRRSLTVLLVGTTACNLACTYCYVGDVRLGHVTVTQFKEIFRKLDSYFDPDIEFNIVFHGGEPLMLGKDFYRNVFAFLKQQSRNYTTAIQSNLTLITPDLIELFRDNGCQIGTSIDGTRQMHDYYRIHKGGRGSFDEVLDKIKLVNAHDSSAGVIATLNKENIEYPDELYESFRSYGAAAVFFSFVYLADDTTGSVPRPKELGTALIKLFDMWMTDPEPVNLPYFGEVLRAMLGIPRNQSCRFAPDCTEYFLAIDPQGYVYPCCDFVTQPAYQYGNIFTDDFASIWDSPVRKQLSQRESILSNGACKDCEYQSICHGGCMAKTMDPAHERDYYCAAYKLFFSHVRGALKTQLEN